MRKLLSSVKAKLKPVLNSSVKFGMSNDANESNSCKKFAHMVDQNHTQICILDQYIKSVPNPQNVLDIFKGEWASKLPKPYDNLEAGSSQLFEDPRIPWAVEQFGGVKDKNILGGHPNTLAIMTLHAR